MARLDETRTKGRLYIVSGFRSGSVNGRLAKEISASSYLPTRDKTEARPGYDYEDVDTSERNGDTI